MARFVVQCCAALLAAIAFTANDRAAVAQQTIGGTGGIPLAGGDVFTPRIDFGPSFFGSNNQLSFRGSGVGSGGTFTDSSLNVMPTLRLFGDYAPGGWNGGFVGGFVGLGLPTGGSSGSFTTSNGIAVSGRVSPTGPWLDFGARAGTLLPSNALLPNGQIFVQAGGSFQQFNTHLSAPSVGDNFRATDASVRPLIGVGATLPIITDWGPINLGFTFNVYPGLGDTKLPGGNLLSFGTFEPNTGFAGLLTFGFPLAPVPAAPPPPPPLPQTTSLNPRPPLPPPPPPPPGEGIGPITQSTTMTPYCPYPSGRVAASFVDEDLYVAPKRLALFGTTDTISSLADMVAQLKGMVAPHYDPTGKCGKCIDTLSVWGHANSKGQVSFGSDALGAGGTDSRQYRSLIADIGKLMCVGGAVVFNQCSAGAGRGADTLQAFADKIGVPVSGPKESIVGCRAFGGALTDYETKKPAPGANTPESNKAGAVSAP